MSPFSSSKRVLVNLDKRLLFRPLSCLVAILLLTTVLAWVRPFISPTQPETHPTDISLLSFLSDYGVPVNGSFAMDFSYYDVYSRQLGPSPGLYLIQCPNSENYFYFHPPLMVVCFLWVRLFSPVAASRIWSAAVLIGVYIISLSWLYGISALSSVKRPIKTLAVAALLLTAAYPALFAFERGNTDALILFMLSLSAWTFYQRRWFWAGFIVMTAGLTKLYPLALCGAIAVLAAAALLTHAVARSSETKLFKSLGLEILGGIAAGALIPAVFLNQLYLQYFFKILPTYEPLYAWGAHLSVIAHSWRADYKAFGVFLFIMLWALGVFIFCVSALQWVRVREERTCRLMITCFAFLTALCVFYAGISYDYNLIILIPLICALALWEDPHSRYWMGAGLCLLLLGYSLPRWVHELWLPPKPSFSPYLVIETLGMVAVGGGLAVSAVAGWRRKNDST